MITVCNIVEAELLAPQYDTLITAGPHQSEVRWHHRHHIARHFIDATTGPLAPSRSAIATLLRFPRMRPVLVHCHKGESRSTAVAIGIAIADGCAPLDAWAALEAQHPAGRAFTPNRLILAHVEDVLGVTGLVAHAERHERIVTSTAW